MGDKQMHAPGYAKTKPKEEEGMSFEDAMVLFNQGNMKAQEYIIGMLQEILRRLPTQATKKDEKKVIML